MTSARKPISSRVQYIYKEYYSKKAEERYTFILKNAESFCEGSGLPKSVDWQVLEIKVRALVRSYFLDVIKYKEYHFEPSLPNPIMMIHSKQWMDAVHGNKQINDPKVAAFTMKWIVKHGPLAFWNTSNELLSVDEEHWINTANARFAVSIALKLIDRSIFSIPPDKLTRLYYHLTYRGLDDRSLFGWMDNMLTKPSSRSFNVFLASPGDVKELRDAAQQVIEEINEQHVGPTRKLNLYRWEVDKKASATSDLQKEIFHEAKDKWGGGECDILIVLVWHKFGEGTQKEFDRFFSEFIDNPSRKFIFCRYGKAVSPDEIDGTSKARLDEWVKSKQDGFSPLNAERGSVKTIKGFKIALARELQIFIREVP